MKIHSKKTKNRNHNATVVACVCGAIAYYTFPVAYKLFITVIPFITILQL